MTLDEAKEAGQLAEALAVTNALLKFARAEKTADMLGVDVSWDHSDSGSSLRSGPILPKAVVAEILSDLHGRIGKRLLNLGVTI